MSCSNTDLGISSVAESFTVQRLGFEVNLSWFNDV